jgi:hypothetical protein
LRIVDYALLHSLFSPLAAKLGGLVKIRALCHSEAFCAHPGRTTYLGIPFAPERNSSRLAPTPDGATRNLKPKI